MRGEEDSDEGGDDGVEGIAGLLPKKGKKDKKEKKKPQIAAPKGDWASRGGDDLDDFALDISDSGSSGDSDSGSGSDEDEDSEDSEVLEGPGDRKKKARISGEEIKPTPGTAFPLFPFFPLSSPFFFLLPSPTTSHGHPFFFADLLQYSES
jgi:hypothetical protein